MPALQGRGWWTVPGRPRLRCWPMCWCWGRWSRCPSTDASPRRRRPGGSGRPAALPGAPKVAGDAAPAAADVPRGSSAGVPTRATTGATTGAAAGPRPLEVRAWPAGPQAMTSASASASANPNADEAGPAAAGPAPAMVQTPATRVLPGLVPRSSSVASAAPAPAAPAPPVELAALAMPAALQPPTALAAAALASPGAASPAAAASTMGLAKGIASSSSAATAPPAPAADDDHQPPPVYATRRHASAWPTPCAVARCPGRRNSPCSAWPAVTSSTSRARCWGWRCWA